MHPMKFAIIRLNDLADRAINNAATLNQIQINALLNDLEIEFRNLRLMNPDIESVDPNGELEKELINLSTRYNEARIILMGYVQSTSTVTKSSPTESEISTLLMQQSKLIENLTCKDSSRYHDVKLPKVEVPKFSGNTDEWLTFRDLYNSTIHNNQKLDEAQKFHYLKSLLSGEAQSIIKSIPISTENYPIAWESILNRYDNPYLVVRTILQDFLKIETVSQNLVNFRKVSNQFRETVQLLDAQGTYAASRDPWVIQLMLGKLDRGTKHEWAEEIRNNNEPSLREFLNFLEKKRATLERFSDNEYKRDLKPSFRVNSIINQKCALCDENHSIYRCKKFLALTVPEREKHVSKQFLCFNCLGKNHSLKECKSTKNCQTCSKRHNTLLHRAGQETKTINSQRETKNDSDQILRINSSHTSSSQNLLPTVTVKVFDRYDNSWNIRALLDTGAQANFVSETVFNQLGLTREQVRVPVLRLSDTKGMYSKGKALVKLHSCYDSSDSITIEAHILPQLITEYPQSRIDIPSYDEVSKRFPLADPDFNVPGGIDMILNSPVFFSILKTERYYHKLDKLFIQNTLFGHIVCNKEDNCSETLFLNDAIIGNENNHLDNLLERFWTLEEPPSQIKSQRAEDIECEKHFAENLYKAECGRFGVRLPFNKNKASLGSTYNSSLQRFLSLERKLDQCPELQKEYQKFMADYESLGHMKQTDLSVEQLKAGEYYIIPHHGIWQGGVTQKKLRVVFDASAKSSTGLSLNDVLHTGPALQSDLSEVIMKFRVPRYVITADIEKMYRQIFVSPKDQLFQLIFWRSSKNDPVKLYQLLTVTYGVTTSPFLAIRTVHELATQNKIKYPQAAKILLSQTFVDDILFGHDDQNQLKSIQKELIDLLQIGGFKLHKWTANDSDLLKDFPSNSLVNPHLFSADDMTIKTLGIIWSPREDAFMFKYQTSILNPVTKRIVLSETAKIFDPLGWISPVVLSFKSIFQETWLHQLDWDAPLPTELNQLFTTLHSELPLLQSVRIPRHLGTGKIELCGFCDASMKAYAAVVYCRRISPDGHISVNLLISKTKLAPIRQISIPRLELCGAHLLAKIISHLGSTFADPNPHVSLWCDSTTVLSWIKSLPRRWNPFVANRVGQIHELCPRIKWNYIKSHDNPADLASRGSSPSNLVNCKEWWSGPTFLHQPTLQVMTIDHFETHEEERQTLLLPVVTPNQFWGEFINKYSSFDKLVRVFSYIVRLKWVHKSDQVITRTVLRDEYISSLDFLIRLVQKDSYPEEHRNLSRGLSVPNSSRLKSLAPILDEKQHLRVGGRLGRAENEFSFLHPLILPNDHFSNLLISKFHHEYFHAGPQLTFSLIRRHYWIPNLRKSIQAFIHKCKQCIKYSATTYKPEMSELPKSRVTPSRPFANVGIDFAGPILLRPYVGRGKLTVKGYIAVFICFSTKAMHLELIMSLSTESLLMGLNRFVARRGLCENIWSDNGKNFINCNRMLIDFYKGIQASAESVDIQNFLTEKMIKWHFIPVYAPHFGGLWEAGVKNVKKHLARVFDQRILTIEEMTTALCQIEFVLNSRPISPLTLSDSYDALTPNHFLIGSADKLMPNLATPNEPASLKNRLNCTHQLTSGFWKRWKYEYLDTLIRRPKWTSSSHNAQKGDLVLIRRLFQPPGSWPTGIIESVLPSTDGIVRTVEVRTVKGISKEAVRNLIPLKVVAEATTGGGMFEPIHGSDGQKRP